MSLEKIDALLKKLAEAGVGAAPSGSTDKQAADIIRNAAAALLKKHPEMKKDIDAFLKGAVGEPEPEAAAGPEIMAEAQRKKKRRHGRK